MQWELTIFGDVAHKMPIVTAINIPEGADGKAIRGMLLNEFGIEIATSFGPLDGKISSNRKYGIFKPEEKYPYSSWSTWSSYAPQRSKCFY